MEEGPSACVWWLFFFFMYMSQVLFYPSLLPSPLLFLDVHGAGILSLTCGRELWIAPSLSLPGMPTTGCSWGCAEELEMSECCCLEVFGNCLF